MRYREKSESGLYLFIQDGQYHMDLPYPFINKTVNENAVSQPLIFGSYLLSIFNMDFSCVESILDVCLDAVNDMEYIENVSLEEILDNCRDTIISYMIKDNIFDYCVKPESDLYIFSELIVTQLFDTIITSKETGLPLSFDDILSNLKMIRQFSHKILDSKTISEDCMLIIRRQTPCVQYDYINNQLVQKYYIRSIFELFALDTYMYLRSPSKMCFCKLCNHYFIKRKRNTEAYCHYPNPLFDGKTCYEYHAENLSYKDSISEIVSRAIKTQNKYLTLHIEDKSYEIWYNWTAELSKREKEARRTGDTANLKSFISNTRFSKTGFSNIDYSDL